MAAIFEKYHPLLSAHYRLDWLTLFKLKEVYALRHDPAQAAQSGRETDATIEDTARYVNQAMRLIMRNEALLYGIGDKKTQVMLGSICLWQFDAALTQGQLRFEVLPAGADQAVMTEVLPRVVGFAFFELGLSQLQAVLPANATEAIGLLTAAHFTAGPFAHERTLASGTKVPLVQLTVTKDAVADDAAFHF